MLYDTGVTSKQQTDFTSFSVVIPPCYSAFVFCTRCDQPRNRVRTISRRRRRRAGRIREYIDHQRRQGKITQRLFRVYSAFPSSFPALSRSFSLSFAVSCLSFSHFPAEFSALRPVFLTLFLAFAFPLDFLTRLVVKRVAVARSSSTKKEESIYCTATHIRVRAQSIAAASFEISKEPQTRELSAMLRKTICGSNMKIDRKKTALQP